MKTLYEIQREDMLKAQPAHEKATKRRMINESVKSIQERYHNPQTQTFLIKKRWDIELDADREGRDYADQTPVKYNQE